MVFEKDFHDILPLIDGPLSIIEVAKAKCLPPFLHINQIAELLYPDIEKFQEGALMIMKKAIRDREGRKFALDQVRQIAEQIVELEGLGMEMEALKLRDQKEALEDHVKKSYGLFGRSRKTSDQNENLRKRIPKAVSNTLKKMGLEEGEELAVYFDGHLKKGFFCSFRKDPDIIWKVIKK